MTIIIDQRSNIYDLVHEARYYMIFFFTKPWDVHHFSCTPQVFLPLLHAALPQHILHILFPQETHAKHSEHLLPPLLYLPTLIEVRKLCCPKSKFVSLQLHEVRKKIFKKNLVVFAVDPEFPLSLRSHQLLQNHCVDVSENIFIILVFARVSWLLNFFFPLLLSSRIFFRNVRVKNVIRRILVCLVKLHKWSGEIVEAEIIFCIPNQVRVI